MDRFEIFRDLSGTDEWVLDTAGEEEGDAIGVEAPYERSYTQGGAFGRDDLQPDDSTAPEARTGHDFGAIVADVEDLAGIAMSQRFDHHRPIDPGSGMLATIPEVLAGHRLTLGQLACPIQGARGDAGLRMSGATPLEFAALLSVTCRTRVTRETLVSYTRDPRRGPGQGGSRMETSAELKPTEGDRDRSRQRAVC